MFNTSYIELSKSALKSNLEFIHGLLKDGVKLSSVVKGNAYGHGIEQFVPMAEELGVDHFSVFNAEEARRVLKVTENSEIMIMGQVDNEQLEWAIMNDIQFFVFENDRLKQAQLVASQLEKKARIHIELETGFNRTGLSEEELKVAVKVINEHPDCFEVEGVCTHYAGAESVANYVRIHDQIKKYKKLCRWIERQGIEPKRKHTACSAAVIAYPKTQMDMVRVGILQYGLWPSRETLIHYVGKQEDKQDPLTRVISWKSKVMSTKNVEAGEFIGYGTSFMAGENMKIATVPVGYAYGYSRSLSNLGRVIINGMREQVIGIVNMNIIVVDICDIPNTQKGDEVILIGEQEGIDVSVHSFGELSEQLNYELLTRLPNDIPRLIVD